MAKELGTFIITTEAPENGKFMDTHWEWSGFTPYANCNGCGAQGHADEAVSDERGAHAREKVGEALSALGWTFFWMRRTDTLHCWQKATCPDCTNALAARLDTLRTIGSESSNLNERF